MSFAIYAIFIYFEMKNEKKKNTPSLKLKQEEGEEAKKDEAYLIVLINTNWMRKNALETSSWCCNNGEKKPLGIIKSEAL